MTAKNPPNEAATTKIDWPTLIAAATQAREGAYAPYSRFQVGAALLTKDGTIVPGCNVENRSYGLCLCAERLAVSRAVSEGRRDFVAIAVVTDCSPPGMPCGMCLETLTEFAPDLPVMCSNPAGEQRLHTLRQLHPTPFEWPEDELPLGSDDGPSS